MMNDENFMANAVLPLAKPKPVLSGRCWDQRKGRCKNTPSVLRKKLKKTPTIEDYLADFVNDTDTGSEDDIILLDELPQDDLESLASDVHPSGTRRSQGSTSQKLFSEEVSQEPVNIVDASTLKAVKASLTRSSTSMKKLVSIPKNDGKNEVVGFQELSISSTFRDVTNVPKQSCNVMNPKNTNNRVEQHQTGSLTPTGNIRKRLNFEDNPPTPESSAMTTLLEQNGSSTAFSQKSTNEFSVMTQSEVLNLKYSAILHAEPCSEDEFVIEGEMENNNFSFLPLLGSVRHCSQLSSVSVLCNEHDDAITQIECTNKKMKHVPKKSGKNCSDLQKAKLTTRPSAIAKPTSLDLKAGIEVEHLPRKKRETAGDSKVVADAKSWKTGSTVSMLDNREAPGSAAKKRKKNVSYNNDDKNGSQDDETGLQRKQKSQQMQRPVRSKKLETCVTQSTTARVSSPFEETCPTQNLIPNNNSPQPRSPPDEPSPSQRKRQMSSCQHLARQASPSKQSKRVPDRLASPSRSSPDRLAKTRRPQGKRKNTELSEKSCVEAVCGQSDNSSIPDQRVIQKRARSTVKAGVQKSKGQRKDKEGFNYHPNQKQQKASFAEVFEEEKREEEMYLLSTSSVPMDENTDLESDFNSSVTQSEDTKLEYSAILQAEPCSEEEFVIEDDTEENNFCISTLPGSLNHCNQLSSSVSVSSNGHDGSILQREGTNTKAKQANTTKHVSKKSGKNCNSVKKAKLASVTTRPSAIAKPTSLDPKAGDEIEHLPRKKRVTSGDSKVVADAKSWKTGSTVSVTNNREAPGSAAKKRKKNVSHTHDKNASQGYETGLQRKQKSQQMQRPVRSKKLETCVTQSTTARMSSPFEETCPTQNLISNNDSFQPRSPPYQRKRQVSHCQHLARQASPSERSKRSPDRLAKTRHLQRKRKDTELGENSLVEAICDQSDDNLSISDQRVLQKWPRATMKVRVRKSKSQSKSQEAFNHSRNQKERKASSAKVFEEKEEIYFSSTNSTSMDENQNSESDNDNSSISDPRVLQKRPRSTVKAGVRKPKGQSKNQEVFNHHRNQWQKKASSAKVFEEKQQEEEMYLASTSSTSMMDENHELESDNDNSSIPDQMVLQKRPRSTAKAGVWKPKGQSKNEEAFNLRRSQRQQKASSLKVLEEQQEEEIYFASTSSTSMMDENHDLESETMLSSPGPRHNPKRPASKFNFPSEDESTGSSQHQLHTQKIFLPNMTPGMRRSQRLRVPPLEHWRGERIEYVHKSGVFSIQGVISPKIQVKTRKGRSKSEKPIYNGQGFNATAQDMGIRQNEVDHFVNMVKHHNLDTVDPEIGTPVLSPGQTEQVNVDCIRTSEMCLYMGPDRNPLQPSDRLGIWKMFSFSNFASGLLKLHPLQEKGLQYVKHDTMWFHILQGILHVTIHQTSYMVKLGDTFFIPAGNVYNIKNVGRTEARLCFVQIKNQLILDK